MKAEDAQRQLYHQHLYNLCMYPIRLNNIFLSSNAIVRFKVNRRNDSNPFVA